MGEDVRVYFGAEHFSDADLEELMRRFCALQTSSFEIALVRYGERCLQVSIGNKSRHFVRDFGSGEYFAHSHPAELYSPPENSDETPPCFRAGILPSGGDVRGFIKAPHAIANGTRVFSKNGHSFIRPIEGAHADAADYSAKYLDLFLGKNALGLETDEEVIDYFRNMLGLELSFAYNSPAA